MFLVPSWLCWQLQGPAPQGVYPITGGEGQLPSPTQISRNRTLANGTATNMSGTD